MLKQVSHRTNPIGETRGVTLIEILLVIAIIAILAALLMPVFTSSKDQSVRIKCVSNLAQLGKAFQTYLSDWNGVYPSPGGRYGEYNCWSQTGDGGLVRYVRSKGGVGTVWCCPVLKKWDGIYPARTYGMNSCLRGSGGGYDWFDRDYNTFLKRVHDRQWHIYGCPENLMDSPRRTILLYEGIPVTPAWNYAEDYIYRCGDWTCVRGYYLETRKYNNTRDSWLAWHGIRSNYLYCDGHVACRIPCKMKVPEYLNTTPDEVVEWKVKKK